MAKKTVIALTPQSVTAEKIPYPIFSLTGFTIQKEAGNTKLIEDIDSATSAVDSVIKAAADAVKEAVREAEEQPGKKEKSKFQKFPSKNTHTQPTKSTPIKPKD